MEINEAICPEDKPNDKIKAEDFNYYIGYYQWTY